MCIVDVELILRSFRHDSIPTAIQQLQAWGPYYNVSFDATEDQSKINVANLAQYDALLFVHSTGNSEFFACPKYHAPNEVSSLFQRRSDCVH